MVTCSVKTVFFLTLDPSCSELQLEPIVPWSESHHSNRVFHQIWLTGWHGTVAHFCHRRFHYKFSFADPLLCSVWHLKQRIRHQGTGYNSCLTSSTFNLKRWKQVSYLQWQTVTCWWNKTNAYSALLFFIHAA